jgi:hypothetical protein
VLFDISRERLDASSLLSPELAALGAGGARGIAVPGSADIDDSTMAIGVGSSNIRCTGAEIGWKALYVPLLPGWKTTVDTRGALSSGDIGCESILDMAAPDRVVAGDGPAVPDKDVPE